MRHKQIHFLNLPAPLKYLYDFCRSRFSQKMRTRFLVSITTQRVIQKVLHFAVTPSSAHASSHSAWSVGNILPAVHGCAAGWPTLPLAGAELQ